MSWERALQYCCQLGATGVELCSVTCRSLLSAAVCADGMATEHIAHVGGGGGCLLEGMGLPMAHVWMDAAETLWKCDTDTWQGNASVAGPF